MELSAHKSIARRKSIIHQKLGECNLCPRNCGVDRVNGSVGYCGLDWQAYCFRQMIHNSEEQQLVPSHQVYFAGCNLKCGYCSVAEWNAEPKTIDKIPLQDLADIIAEKQQAGAKTLNLLGGEPAVSIYGILELLELVEPTTLVVWNSNMYYSKIVGDVLDGLADVYLADFKCWEPDCCKAVLGTSDYAETAKYNIKRACNIADVILRYLVLPGHYECCCEPILEWIASEIPNVKVSLRFNYIPPIPANNCPGGYLEETEMQAVLDKAKQLKLNLIK